ncbi:hypothetical protein V6N13_029734 [Hibiscus sabdariffa]
MLDPNLEDKLIWIHDRVGVFSLKKVSSLLLHLIGDFIDIVADKLWKVKVPPKIQSFIWLVYLDRVPTKEFLLNRGLQILETLKGCPLCGSGVESSHHLLFACGFANCFWLQI